MLATKTMTGFLTADPKPDGNGFTYPAYSELPFPPGVTGFGFNLRWAFGSGLATIKNLVPANYGNVYYTPYVSRQTDATCFSTSGSSALNGYSWPDTINYTCPIQTNITWVIYLFPWLVYWSLFFLGRLRPMLQYTVRDVRFVMAIDNLNKSVWTRGFVGLGYLMTIGNATVCFYYLYQPNHADVPFAKIQVVLISVLLNAVLFSALSWSSFPGLHVPQLEEHFPQPLLLKALPGDPLSLSEQIRIALSPALYFQRLLESVHLRKSAEHDCTATKQNKSAMIFLDSFFFCSDTDSCVAVWLR